jgi:plastocyanin
MYSQTVRRSFLPLALAAAFALAGASLAAPASSPPIAPTAPAAASAGPVVKIDNFTFGPAALVVKPGTTVTWINGDDVPHAVVAVDSSFRSKVLDTGDRYAFTFAKTGEYAYFCSLHPHMVGKIVVRN